jgi:hypothetical protein
MKVLVACEFSGTVRRAFAALGHDAWSCDFLPSSDDCLQHYVGDVCDLLQDRMGWDLMIAHPPCTYMANSGVCWLHRDETRWQKMRDAAALFRLLVDANIPRIAVENPVMHKYAKAEIGGARQDQVIQPYQFGHLEQKATCLWLKGLPALVPTSNLKAETFALPANQRQRLHYLPPSKDRWAIRSKTYDGIAAAMAAQWGGAELRLAA